MMLATHSSTLSGRSAAYPATDHLREKVISISGNFTGPLTLVPVH
jgi:hypothetical protein